jgi:hypothetical protein
MEHMSKSNQASDRNESRGPAFDAANQGSDGVSNDISAKSGTKALTREQRHAAQIKRSGAGHEKQQTASTVESDRIARYVDACKRNGQTPDTSQLKHSSESSSKPDYLKG